MRHRHNVLLHRPKNGSMYGHGTATHTAKYSSRRPCLATLQYAAYFIISFDYSYFVISYL